MLKNHDEKLRVIYEHSDFFATDPQKGRGKQRAKASLALIKRLGPKLEIFLLRRFSSLTATDAEDIVQETFIEIAKKGQIKRDGSFFGFTWKIAYRKALRVLKKRGRLKEELQNWPAYEEDPCLKNEDRELVLMALNRLEPEDRQILDLYYFEDLTVPEIAELMHKTVSYVESRKWRARKVLKKDLNTKRKNAEDENS